MLPVNCCCLRTAGLSVARYRLQPCLLSVFAVRVLPPATVLVVLVVVVVVVPPLGPTEDAHQSIVGLLHRLEGGSRRLAPRLAHVLRQLVGVVHLVRVGNE